MWIDTTKRPEILMDSDHELLKSDEVIREIISRLYSKLIKHKVKSEHTIRNLI